MKGGPWEWEWYAWVLLGVVFVGSLWWDKRRKAVRGMSGVVFVRAAPPRSNFLKNLIVVAVVIGLFWFFSHG
jgi:hypothetical protein